VPVEHEVKLAFASLEAARQAVIAAGGRLAVSRRLLDDRLFDTTDLALRRAGTALRVRRDRARAVLTWKGPVEPGPVKSREERETGVDDADVLERVIGALGYHEVFRAQKYREEYRIDVALIVIDETPMGVFVEIEADPDRIASLAAALGRTPSDFDLRSYPLLWRQWCEARGLGLRDMVFGGEDRSCRR
jgi:adenylate cyclase, class 2